MTALIALIGFGLGIAGVVVVNDEPLREAQAADAIASPEPEATPTAAATAFPEARLPQMITMGEIPETTTDGLVVVEARSSSLLPVEISVSGSCKVGRSGIDKTDVVATKVGNCVVTAEQEGDETYEPAEPVTQIFRFNGGHARAKIAIDGVEWMLAAQGLPLRIPVKAEATASGGRIPSGSVTVILRRPGTDGCSISVRRREAQ